MSEAKRYKITVKRYKVHVYKCIERNGMWVQMETYIEY